MSAARPELDDSALLGAPGERAAAMRVYAALPSGVHALPLAQAVELLRAARARGGADGVAAAAPSVPLLWIDVANPGEAEAAFLREELGFHPLAVEDTVRGRQRPKLERYAGYLFLVVYAAAVNRERHRMALSELHMFLGERLVVTVHDHRIREVSEVVARWRAAPHLLVDVPTLAHALLDALVDDYFPVLEYLAERTEHFESAVFDGRSTNHTQAILGLRHELVLFRRVVAPVRDLLSTLLRRDLPFISPEMLPYYQDVYDHTIRVTEEIDAQRELLSALLDAQMSAASNQLNQTVRMMTGWSIILMSMAWIAGVYGMNFRFMPELGWRWGYVAALGLMLSVGSALFAYFRRRGWL